MSRSSIPVRSLALLAFIAAAAPSASAGLVPVGAIGGDGQGALPPTPEIVAEQAIPFFVTYFSDDPSAPAMLVGATLHNVVVRDPLTSQLTFTYQVKTSGSDNLPGGAGSRQLTAASFGASQIDLLASYSDGGAFSTFRSDDGRTAGLASDGGGAAGLTTLIVRTDATAFNSGGTVDYTASDLLPATSLLANTPPTAEGFATVAGAFQPLDGKPTAMPLPPSMWSGLGALAGVLVITRTRRWLWAR